MFGGSSEASDVGAYDLSAKGGAAAGSRFASAAGQGATPQAQYYFGQGADSPVTSAPPGVSADSGDRYSLNFTDAPIPAVTQAIIGDILKQPYAIDPRVQGTLTLSSATPISTSSMLDVLEAALRMNNAVLIRDPALYRIVPASDAAGSGKTEWARGGSPAPGYGISVLPLRYASAQAVLRLVEGFGARPGSIRVEPSSNLLLVAGTAQERQSAISTARAFDVDWMRNQSAGIFPVANASPQAIIRELGTVMGSGGQAGLPSDIRLQPIERMNAVLAVARKPGTVEQIGKWIRRLDRADYGASRIHIYRVRFGRAAALAAILNSSFGKSGSGGGAVNQISPEGEGTTARSAGGFQMNNQQQDSTGQAEPAGGQAGSSGGRPSSQAAGNQQGAGLQTDAASDGSGGPAGLGGASANGSGDALSEDGSGAGGSEEGGNNAFDGVRITPDPSSNSLVIAANAEQYKIIERALVELDREPEQVQIEATIAEVTLNDKLKYGVQYFLRANINGTTVNMAQFGAQTALQQVAPAFNLIVGSETGSRVIIDLLQQVTKVKIVSSPSLVVVNNETAALQVGDQVPVTTRTAQSTDNPDAPTVNEVEFKNTGVILNVRPRISADNMVSIDVDQEISAVVDNTNAETLTPTISQRRVQSQIAVPSGQTVLLGGLISDRQERGRSGIPGLMKVPIIGDLVSNTALGRERTEIIVFIKPQIIRSGQDAASVAKRMRERMLNLTDDN